MFRVLSFSGTSEFDSTRSSNVDALDGGSLTLSDLERVKQEILTEMRREMQKWKIDLIEGAVHRWFARLIYWLYGTNFDWLIDWLYWLFDGLIDCLFASIYLWTVYSTP